jgi:16S rRNA (cytosine967-C5)-methyltransferase
LKPPRRTFDDNSFNPDAPARKGSPKQLYRNLCEAVIDGLRAIFTEGKYADKVIEKTLKQNPKWGARDRRFIAETTYDIVRWYRLFRVLTKTDEKDFWSLLGAWCMWNKIEYPAWEEFEHLSKKHFWENYDKAKATRKLRESLPDWLDKRGEEELGHQWEVEANALNQQAKVVLRVNTLKTSRAALQHQLEAEEGIVTDAPSGYKDALILAERQNIFTRQQFKDGLFEVQDAGSQCIAPYLQLAPGMRVVDACAGAGGKTLHLAALLENKGRIIAMDTEAWKLDELKKRARRAGASNIETRLIDSSKVIKRLENSADRLLLDVPCSGLGVLKRNPDAKWKLSLGFLDELHARQQKLLNEYSIMVKKGGLMVYATCSLLPSENQQQVKAFLAANHTFEFVSESTILPSQGFDGFYMALMKRN